MLLLPVLECALLAVSSPSYATLRSSGEQVSNLGRFLERYLGDCDSDDPSFDKRGCEMAAVDVQKKYDGKVLVIEVEDVEGILTLAEFENAKNAYRLHLTPFFGERALALTIGKPDRLNKDGYPVLKNIPIWVKQPQGEPEFAFKRQLERARVRLEILARPRKPWRLKRKEGGGDYRGVEVALLGIRVYAPEGSKVLAEQTY